MFGKTLGVVEYNLTFGSSTRMVNVFSCFRYKPNGNLYVVYADINTKYEVINYGSSHIRNNNILSMVSRVEDQEIIKEFIYKIINNEELTNFEFINLTDITGIEIVGFNHLEVKLEVIKKLEELTIPKIVEKEKNVEETKIKKELTKEEKKTKKNKKKILLVLLIVIFVVGGGYFYLSIKSTNTVTKQIICTKTYNNTELNAYITETNTYNFDKYSKLSDIDTVNTYKFNEEEDYQDFTYRGLYYKYIPDDNDTTTPSWDNDTYTFKVTYKTTVEPSYNKPRIYEEVINYYSSEGYKCNEKIEEK